MPSPTTYTGSLNPPRKAKRARTSSLLSSPEPSLSDSPTDEWLPAARVSTAPRLLPKPLSAGPPAQVQPQPPTTTLDEDLPKRRGRRPGGTGGLSRSARESLRKQNHSRIEKARRTKINDALAELRILVPKRKYAGNEDGEDDEEDEDRTSRPQARKGKGKPKEREEKEFKLEVLVRTVGYMRELIHRVNELEKCTGHPRDSACMPTHSSVTAARKEDLRLPGASASTASKRKRAHSPFHPSPALGPAAADSEDEESEDEADDEEVEHMPHPGASLSPCLSPTRTSSVIGTPRLPPIASWLPLPLGSADPSALSLPPPSSSSASASASTSQLPSPPPSSQFTPLRVPGSRAMAALALPPPNLKLATNLLAHQPHDEVDGEAAALLLQISASGSGSGSGSTGSPDSRGERSPVAMTPHTTREAFQAQTPSSLLGVYRGRD